MERLSRDKRLKLREVDVFDLNYVYGISYIDNVKQRKSTVSIVLEHLKGLFGFLFHKTKLERADILFYGVTGNNQRSFNTIVENLSDEYINIKDNNDPLLSCYMLYSLVGVPYLLNTYLKSNKDGRKRILSKFTLYLLCYGKVLATRKVLHKVAPKLLILANDHSSMNRCFLRNAAVMGIKTMYVQHASVSDEFPPLQFDYSFLDGRVSFEAYKNTSKPGSVVCLSGPCRFDYMKEYLSGKGVFIGISVNEFDEFERVKKLCLLLKDSGHDKIKVRPHPSMGDWNRTWFNDNGILFSTPKLESPGQYLSSLLLQISNVSGIHLDAVMLGCPSVLYQMSDKRIDDIFHFVDHGIIKVVNSEEELLRIADSPQITTPETDAVRLFVASYKTSVSFSVGAFIAGIIHRLLNENFDNKVFRNGLPEGINAYFF